MGEKTGISWTDHTFNPWHGCQKVSPGCTHCYAERLAERYHQGDQLWGPTGKRAFLSDDYWADPLRWNRAALKAGVRARVFSGSMCDVFEGFEGVRAERERLWELIETTTMLDWLLLSKRPENIKRMVPWGGELKPWPRNVWIGTSVENQKYAEERIPVLLNIPARVRFISYEPAIGPIWWRDEWRGLNWVIVGGESGPKFRPFDMAWARDARDWCAAADIPFFFKQDAGAKNEQRPYLVEKDGSQVEYHQWPGDVRPARVIRLGDGTVPPKEEKPSAVRQLGLW